MDFSAIFHLPNDKAIAIRTWRRMTIWMWLTPGLWDISSVDEQRKLIACLTEAIQMHTEEINRIYPYRAVNVREGVAGPGRSGSYYAPDRETTIKPYTKDYRDILNKMTRRLGATALQTQIQAPVLN